MTSWIWMKDVSVAIADPIEPIDQFDRRPSVKDLLKKNAPTIASVKEVIRNDPLYDATKHDDLFILRFLLSHRRPGAAIKGIQHTLLFRKEQALDETDIRHTPPEESPAAQKYLAHCDSDAILYQIPDPQRGVIGFLRLCGLHHKELVKHLTSEDWFAAYLHITEWTHQWLDYITRTTGRLTKSLRLVDVVGTNMSEISYQGLRRDGQALHKCEDCYPQLLDSLKLCNCPEWIHVPWTVCRVIMPKRIVAKIDFINPQHNDHERNGLFAHISEDHLPERFGGKNKDWPLAFPIPKP